MRIKNFRCFDNTERVIKFRPGLNVLVGENDCGKSAIMDAIRIVLGTTDQGWYRIDLSDFHNEDKNSEIYICCCFSDLTEEECAAFLECLTYIDANGVKAPKLFIHWRCKFLHSFTPARISSSVTTGEKETGPSPNSASKELLRVTFLRALRDAYSEMQSGKNSRLSQIVQNTPNLKVGANEYTEGAKTSDLSLAGIVDLSNKLLAQHPSLKKTNAEISEIISRKMLLTGDSITTKLQVSGNDASIDKKTVSLLEKLDLTVERSGNKNCGRVGLGTSNILSMACELLLNRTSNNNGKSTFLLIEEPEAHIHAQRQLRLIQSIQEEAKNSNQIIVTTHSPLLSSAVDLENLIIVKEQTAFSLACEHTKLDNNDYRYLARYLDVTKANLFFARGVLMVEGPSEELLLPAIATLIGHDLTKSGVSIVNVRGTGLNRFARIFQRSKEGEILKIPVACVTDRDIMPDCAPAICINEKYISIDKFPKRRNWRIESEFGTEKAKKSHLKNIQDRADGQEVKTFVCEHWTLEYDLYLAGLQDEMLEAMVHVKYSPQKREKIRATLQEKLTSYSSVEERASLFYSPFFNNLVSKAVFAQELADILLVKYKDKGDALLPKLPKYLVDAIKYVTII